MSENKRKDKDNEGREKGRKKTILKGRQKIRRWKEKRRK